MDELEPARVIVVEAIATLEDAIENLMTGQAPRSSKADIAEALVSLRKVGEALRCHAELIDGAMKTA